MAHTSFVIGGGSPNEFFQHSKYSMKIRVNVFEKKESETSVITTLSPQEKIVNTPHSTSYSAVPIRPLCIAYFTTDHAHSFSRYRRGNDVYVLPDTVLLRYRYVKQKPYSFCANSPAPGTS